MKNILTNYYDKNGINNTIEVFTLVNRIKEYKQNISKAKSLDDKKML